MSEAAAGSVTGAEGLPVACDVHVPPGPGRAPVVLILHGFKGFKDWGFFPTLAEDLARAGLAAVRMNFSHNGVGAGPDAGSFTRLDLFEQDRMSYRLEDVAAVRRALETGRLPRSARLDAGRCALFGHSLGGAVALLAARAGGFQALVTLAAVPTVQLSREQQEVIERDGRWTVHNARTGQLMPVGRGALENVRRHADAYNLERAAGSLGIPWLIAHGEQDTSVPVEAARKLHAWAAAAATELRVLPGSDHVLNCRHPFQGRTPAYEELLAHMTRFLRRVL